MIADGRVPAAGAGRHLHRQRPLSRRHASDGRALRHAGLARRQDLLLAVQHRPLARHRRRGAGRLLGLGDRGRAGGAAPAAGEAVQEGRARSRRSTRSSAPTSASPTSASATSGRRPRRCMSGRSGCSRILDRYGDETVIEAIAELRSRAAEQMRANIAAIPDGIYRSKAYRRFRRRGRRAADHRAVGRRRRATALTFDFAGSIAALHRADEQRAARPRCRRSISPCATSFPDVPISAGAFEPLIVKRPEGTFLDAHYPRPVSGCAAEVSQRIAEAVFAAHGAGAAGQGDRRAGRLQRQFRARRPRSGARPRLSSCTRSPAAAMAAMPAATASPTAARPSASRSRRRSRSWSRPIPVLYRHYALREGSGGAGQASRRLRPRLRGRAAARRGARLLRHGPRPRRPAGRARRRGRRGQHGHRLPRRRGACADASVQGTGHSAEGRRPRAGRHAGRRRLRRPRASAIRRWSGATSRWATTRPRRRRRLFGIDRLVSRTR